MFFKKTIEKTIEKAQSGENDEEIVIKPGTPKWRYITIAIISVSFLLFQLYIGMIRPLPTLIANPVHLSLALIIVFFYNPLADKHKRKWLWIIDFALIAGAVFVTCYFIFDLERLTYRIMVVDPMLTIDLIVSAILLVILMETVRRTLGTALFAFILFFIAYAFFGQYISGPLRYSGMRWQQFFELLTLTPDGIFGSPLTTSVNSLFYFLLFGAFFSKCGGGEVLIDCGMKLSDKTAGGPAKAAVVSSGLMGMISGSAVANVTTTGVLTIPLMKKAGYTPEQAGAVEAVASTGGQIMPPIMGVGAFIMAEMIGISYANIAVSAIIPAMAYYVSVFVLVHFLAKKKDMKNPDIAEIKYQGKPVLPRTYRLIPIIVVVIMIFIGYSLTRSAMVGTVLSIVISMTSKDTRMNPKQLLDALLDGIKQAANIAIPTAACGIMIGIVIRSGAANKLTGIISSVGGSNIALALILAMLGCMLLGMALPTVAAYLIANILFCPTIIALGIPPLPANMFIFYFGVIAQITPPVCLASFTAAGIAGANSWKTGWTAFAYAAVSFLTPFVFVFQPSLLLLGTAPDTILYSAILLTGIIFLAAGMSGYIFTSMDNKIIQVVMIVLAICVILPEFYSTVIGIAGGGALTLWCFIKSRKDRTKAIAA